nr:glycosyltransferase [Paenibacillus oenotherae]
MFLCNYMLEDVMTERHNRNTFAQSANNKINQIVSALTSNDHQVTLLSSGLVNNRSGRFYKRFKSRECGHLHYASIIDLPILNTVSSLLSMVALVASIRKTMKVDYIIFWNYKPEVAVAAYLCKKLFGIKIIVDYEDGYFSLNQLGFKSKIFNLAEKLVSRHVDGAILISKSLISRIHNKPYMILNGLTNKKVMDYSYHGVKSEKITLMYAGGLDYERGIDVLLEALKYTKQEFTLYITGQGPLADTLSGDCDPRVEYLGYLEYEETIRRMHEADILINPQRETIAFANASFPSKIFDYLATGNLIISSNVADMKAFAKQAFYIYENDNPQQLSACIDQSIRDIQHNSNDDKLTRIRQLKQEFLPENVGMKISATLLN